MKKGFRILLALILGFSLAACSNNKPDEKPNDKPETVEQNDDSKERLDIGVDYSVMVPKSLKGYGEITGGTYGEFKHNGKKIYLYELGINKSDVESEQMSFFEFSDFSRNQVVNYTTTDLDDTITMKNNNSVSDHINGLDVEYCYDAPISQNGDKDLKAIRCVIHCIGDLADTYEEIGLISNEASDQELKTCMNDILSTIQKINS